jgi:hypothetical protein
MSQKFSSLFKEARPVPPKESSVNLISKMSYQFSAQFLEANNLPLLKLGRVDISKKISGELAV